MNYWLTFLTALLIAVITTPLVIRLAKHFDVVDYPTGGRRVHDRPIPLLGGLAMYAAFWLTVLFTQTWTRMIWGLFIGSTIILAAGVWDDIKELRPLPKLLCQIAAASVLLFFGFSVQNVSLPVIGVVEFTHPDLSWLGMLIIVFWVVGLVNTVNISDGLDGLAAGICFGAALILFWSADRIAQYPAANLTLALAGAAFGFLVFNFYPAKIFMGDTGSMFLGYLIGGISIMGLLKTATVLGLVFPLVVLGMPLTDMTFAIVRRKLKGQAISKADRGHLHHRLLDMGYTQRQAVLILYGLSACFGFTAILGTSIGWIWAALLLVFDLFLLVLIFMRKPVFFFTPSKRHGK